MVTLDVELCNKIKVPKEKPFYKLQIPLERHSIVYGGKWLKDNLDVASHDIQKDATLHLVLRPGILFCFLISRIWLNLNFEFQ